MNDRIYQILYCSRNNIRGTVEQRDAEIARILRSSQKNNAAAGVTGALFYNTVFFAQVLEGKFSGVQEVFERLQLDSRHSDLVILQSGYVAARDFGDWSMARVGASADWALPFADLAGREESASGVSVSGAKVLGFLREVVSKQNSWALPERLSAVRPTSPAVTPAV